MNPHRPLMNYVRAGILVGSIAVLLFPAVDCVSIYLFAVVPVLVTRRWADAATGLFWAVCISALVLAFVAFGHDYLSDAGLTAMRPRFDSEGDVYVAILASATLGAHLPLIRRHWHPWLAPVMLSAALIGVASAIAFVAAAGAFLRGVLPDGSPATRDLWRPALLVIAGPLVGAIAFTPLDWLARRSSRTGRSAAG